jgi:hypothetical protein
MDDDVRKTLGVKKEKSVNSSLRKLMRMFCFFDTNLWESSNVLFSFFTFMVCVCICLYIFIYVGGALQRSIWALDCRSLQRTKRGKQRMASPLVW